MRIQNIDREWSFGPGLVDAYGVAMGRSNDRIVNLPHDYMLENEVKPDVPAGPASGYFNAGVAHYRKVLEIPADWEKERVYLRFDGVMLNATVEVNGGKVALHHYGYTPFAVDITPYLYFGRSNSVTVIVNPSMQPNSRWYSGAGIFRSVELAHGPAVHIANDGVYGYTKRIVYDETGRARTAFLQTQVTVRNADVLDHMAVAEVSLVEEATGRTVVSRKAKIQVDSGTTGNAHIAMTVEEPLLWSAEKPNLYRLEAKVTDIGVFKTHFEEGAVQTVDEAGVLFGIRTVEADVKNGLQINGKTVKLKGGCVHHDNGLLGAVSLYDAEARRITKMKEVGFNAIRTTHNPPSRVLMEACDRLGMYVFAEAFDSWGIGKQPGDYNQFFADHWEEDLTDFVVRDRNHPSIVIWSTGNEIFERGGLNHGYTLATKLAEHVKRLDVSRPVSNGICSYWSGIDEILMVDNMRKMQEHMKAGESFQNADGGKADLSWEEMSEAFANGLDIVGYNYMEDKYLQDHELYPDRVILGSENFPKEIGIHWPMVEGTPYVIGDFTWTAYDYIGEAGIGKSVFFEPEDPALKRGGASLSWSSPFPYRLANDADIDINGHILPQGNYRSVVYGSDATYVFSYDPADYGKKELLSNWGFPACRRCWNWPGKEGKKVSLLVFSRAEEVELLVNGQSLGRKKQGEAPGVENLPLTFAFDGVYEPGTVTAVSFAGGREISRDTLVTAGEAWGLRIAADRTEMAADGHGLIYAEVEVVDREGRLVPDAEIALKASVSGKNPAAATTYGKTAAAEGAETVCGKAPASVVLAGFGSGNPITAESYVSGSFTSYRGRACAVLRSGYEAGEAVLVVEGEGLESARMTVKVG